MRFRCHCSVSTLSLLLTVIDFLISCSDCSLVMISLTPDEFRFAVLPEFNDVGMNIYVTLNPNALFPITMGTNNNNTNNNNNNNISYVVQSRANNRIVFMAHLKALSTVFRSMLNTASSPSSSPSSSSSSIPSSPLITPFVLRLSKRLGAATFTCDSYLSHFVEIFDIPIETLQQQRWNAGDEPTLSAPTAMFSLPSPTVLYTFLSKMKGESTVVTLDAFHVSDEEESQKGGGVITFLVYNSLANISLNFKGTKLPFNLEGNSSDVSVSVDNSRGRQRAMESSSSGSGSDTSDSSPSPIIGNGNGNVENKNRNENGSGNGGNNNAVPRLQNANGNVSSSDEKDREADGDVRMSFASNEQKENSAHRISLSSSSSSSSSDEHESDGSDAVQNHKDVEKSPALPPPSRVVIQMRCSVLRSALSVRHLDANLTIGCVVPEGSFILYHKLKENKGNITIYIPLVMTE